MRYQSVQPLSSEVWALAKRQHGVVSRRQLIALGYHEQAIKHRISSGRLHPTRRGVYVVGRPQLTRHGRWMAAVLSCGPGAVLSHESAAALWKIRATSGDTIEISVPFTLRPRKQGIVVHRRRGLGERDLTERHAIPVTSPILTLVDLATCLERGPLESAINEADKRGLTDPEEIRSALDWLPRRPGVKAVRDTLDRRTFKLTDSELERLFLPIASSAGLPLPETGAYVNGFKVDFYWPDLGLVVEADGLRYHRTPAQQTKDRIRDQAHLVAGLTPLRFTHAQVRFEPGYVKATLAAAARQLRTKQGGAVDPA
jgi:hypothetical protein